MRISYIDNNIIIYINKIYRFEDIEDIKKYLQNLFSEIKDKINIKGFYESYIYKDDNYGMVIELIKDEDEYFEYINEIDMHITLEDKIFLYKTEDIFIDNNILNNTEIYIYNNYYYLKITNKLDELSRIKLMEFSELTYKDTNKILNYGKKINYMI